MNNVINTIEKAGFTLEIGYDEFPSNPRDWDSEFSTMLCGHRRYDLGDEQLQGNYNSMKEEVQRWIVSTYWKEFDAFVAQRENTEELKELQEWNYEESDSCNIVEEFITSNFVILPVYMYEHSGIALSTNKFNCSWDSGTLGVILTKITPQSCLESVRKDLASQVKGYSSYVNGDVFEWAIRDSEGNFVDSRGGYLDDEDYCEEEGLQVLEALLRDQQKAELKTSEQFGFAILGE